ncbi:MAG: 4Fe-4S ferredoxin-type protein [Bacteroidota bacterium]|nr:4Fe-4S ferredoxin-type protein [Bacteroidota bacterium]
MNERVTVGTDTEFIRYLKAHGGETMKKCFQCATCTVACSLSPERNAFPRKEMIDAGWGLKDKLIGDPDIWLCHGCMDCSRQCPRGARPADLLGAIRSFIYKTFSVPKFMGEALSSPKYLLGLFILPVIIIFALVLITNTIVHGGDMKLFSARGEIIAYADFIHKLAIEGLFIPGNLLIFALAAIGLKRYWDAMKKQYPDKPKIGFIAAAWQVKTDFLMHRKFDQCGNNSNRYYGHIYTFYGFLGTMIATGLVVVGEFYHYGHLYDIPFLMSISFYLPYPMGLMHPVKILGMVSGVFLFIGVVLFIVRRIKQQEREGINTYNDWLFLWVLCSIAFTGIGIVLLRMILPIDLAFIAYSVYFIHLVLVFFLLWYMPYSKFGHMVYRLLGLIFLKMHGRDSRDDVYN